MPTQLPLDFSASAAQRLRRAKSLVDDPQLPLFAWSPNMDVHLHSPAEAVAHLAGAEWERAELWLRRIVGSEARLLKSRRVAFPTSRLDRLLHVVPPAQVTLDGPSLAVARAIWAAKAGLKPMRVMRDRRRLIASSPRWPANFNVVDAPWTTIAAITHLGLPLDVDDDARLLLADKLAASGAKIASASLAGTAVSLSTSRPELLEDLGLPALAYEGGPGAGRYRMPVLTARCLLDEPSIALTPELEKVIRRQHRRVTPLKTGDDFPWTLYPFQARDAGSAHRILEWTGGVLLAGEMGSGKALRSTEPVATASGPVPIGSLQVGDQVLGTDGKPHAVLGVYPQGVRELFRVTFSDGSTVDCDDEHLWLVNTPLRRWRGQPGRVKPLREIRQRLVDGAGNRQHFVPVPEPLAYEGTGPLAIDPYVLGVLLGDGSIVAGTPTVTTADPWVVDELRRILEPDGFRVEHSSRYTWRITDPTRRGGNRLRDELKQLGLWGKRAWEKSIPARYRYAPPPDRLALLQGLADTDGNVKNAKQLSSVDYTTTSEDLAYGIQELMGSLGGAGRINGPVRKTYTHNGERRTGRPAWRLTLQLPPGTNPFRLPRKAEQFRPREKYQPARAIVSVEPIGRGEAVCVSVDSPDRCFVLANGVVTHNTTIALALAQEMDLWPALVVAPLSAFSTWERQLAEMGRSAYLATETPAKSWAALEEGGHDAVVISFDRLAAFTEIIERYGFTSIIADEIQRIRSPGSKRSRALRSLAGTVPYRIGLSGTPLTNTVADLLPIGAFLVPGEWKPRASNKDLADQYPGDPIEAVAEHLGSMMVRRRMTDTGAKLPGRNDHRVMVQLTPEQRRALHDLEEEARRAKEDGAFDDPSQKLHAFVRLHRARQIINCPAAAGVAGPNPKVTGAVELAEDFIAEGRKGVIFTADRTSFVEIGKALDVAGIGWVGIWGSTPPQQRIDNEKRFHTDPDIKVVVCTIQAGAESWSASPTGTWLISTAYMYQAAVLEQMECRVYRMSSDPDGPDIEICYLHAQAPGGTLDDRMVEILTLKKALFAQVVDRTVHVDQTKTHYSMGDLVYLLTGERDEAMDALEADKAAVVAREQDRKRHARASAHRHKGRNKTDEDLVLDDGSLAQLLDTDDLTARYDADDPAGDDDTFDVEDGDDG